jgi:hypothetical protein
MGNVGGLAARKSNKGMKHEVTMKSFELAGWGWIHRWWMA